MAQTDRLDDPADRVRRLLERDRGETVRPGAQPVPDWASISEEARDGAAHAATRAGIPLARWLERAIMAQVRAEHRGHRGAAPREAPPVDLGELERLIGLAGQVAAAGEGLPPSVRRAVNAAITGRLKPRARRPEPPAE